MKRVLVIRLSALGDVAMVIPVIYSLAEAYPDVQFTLVTQPAAAGLFINRPDNLRVFPAHVKGSYRGVRGIFRLFRDLKTQRFDAVADLHDVLRTQVLRGLFRVWGVKTACIDKGRKSKKRLTRRKKKEKQPLKSSFERYAEVFGKLGFSFRPSFVSLYKEGRGDRNIFSDICIPDEKVRRIGIAPFAKHRGKIYPPASMEQVVHYFADAGGYQIFLFGGGEKETRTLKEWAGRYPSTVCVAGKHGFEKELALISWLDVMVSMDSANMHLASLTGVPVVSVWGATHPYAGFMGWNQQLENSIGAHLPCRPCSVFGNKLCFRGDYACLKNICPEMIIGRVECVLNSKSKRNE